MGHEPGEELLHAAHGHGHPYPHSWKISMALRYGVRNDSDRRSVKEPLMDATQDRFHRLLQEARDDPAILGIVLTGSRGKGFGRADSDYDVLLVVRHEDLSAYQARFYEQRSWVGFDWWVSSLPELAPVAAEWGDPLAWEILCNERYSFADVSVLLDKTGQLQELVDAKGAIPEERRLPIARTALGAYTNSLYRSLRCLRRGDPLGARLEAADAIGHALTAIFALEGRHRPYYGYLARELAARPLRNVPLPADELLAMLETILDNADPATQQRLLAIVDDLGRQAGCGDAFDEWEDRYLWMQTFRPD
jgi:predicted nucleotidyltransferase